MGISILFILAIERPRNVINSVLTELLWIEVIEKNKVYTLLLCTVVKIDAIIKLNKLVIDFEFVSVLIYPMDAQKLIEEILRIKTFLVRPVNGRALY